MRKIWYKFLIWKIKNKKRRQEKQRLIETQRQIRKDVLNAIAHNDDNIYVSWNQDWIDFALNICDTVGVKVKVREHQGEYKMIARDE